MVENKDFILKVCILVLAILTLLAGIFMALTDAKYASCLQTPNTINLEVVKSTENSANSAYAVYTNNAVSFIDGVKNLDARSLTFKFDDQSGVWAQNSDCIVYAMNEGSNEPKWVTDQSTNITLVNIENSFNQYQPTTCYKWFNGFANCSNAPYGCEYINTSVCTNMSCMFASYGLNYLTNDVPDVSGWNTSNVVDMSSMFYGYGLGSSSLTKVPDVSGWNTSNVKNVSNIFNSYGFSSTSLVSVPNVSSWDLKDVTNMSSMFSSYGYKSATLNTVPDVSGWNTSNVGDMSSMFNSYAYTSSSLIAVPNVSNWVTSNVTNMAYMFSNYGVSASSANFVLDLINFDFTKVTTTEYMFAGMSHLTTIGCNKDLNSKTDLISDSMFSGCTNLVGGSGTLYDSTKIDKTYARPDGYTSLPGYFTSAAYAVFTSQEVSSNDGILTLPAASLTFFYDTNKQSWIDKGCSCYDMNEGFNEPGWLAYSSSINSITIDKSFANYKPTTCYKWFNNLSNCISAPSGCEYINTSACTDMSYMFYQFGFNSTTLNSVPNVTNWNTSQVTNMSNMFYGYGKSSESSFTLNLSGFDFEKVTNIDSMFQSMTGLALILCNADLSDRIDLSSTLMFDGCTKLIGGKGTSYDFSKVDKTYARPDIVNDSSLVSPGYFTAVDTVTLTGDNTIWTQYGSEAYITKAYIADNEDSGETLYIKPTVTSGYKLDSVEIIYVDGTTGVLVSESSGTYAGYYKIKFSFDFKNLNMTVKAVTSKT